MPKIVDHNTRRQEFIDAACDVIIEKGLGKASMRVVAKRAGYTTGALVHYFADKEDLIEQALRHFDKGTAERIQEVRRNHRGRAALRESLLCALPIDRASAGPWKVWLALWYHSAEHGQAGLSESKSYRDSLSKLWMEERLLGPMREAIEDGELSPDVDVTTEAAMLACFTDGLGLQFLTTEGELDPELAVTMLDRQIDQFFERNRPARKPRAKAS